MQGWTLSKAYQQEELLINTIQNMKTMKVIEKTPSAEVLEMEISSLENLVASRQRWLEIRTNKRRTNYGAVASDTRRLRDTLEEKRSQLAELKKEMKEARA